MSNLNRAIASGKILVTSSPITTGSSIGVLVELPIGTKIKTKYGSLEVSETPNPYSCEGCEVESKMFEMKSTICDGMCCLRAMREDNKNIILKKCNSQNDIFINDKQQHELNLS